MGLDSEEEWDEYCSSCNTWVNCQDYDREFDACDKCVEKDLKKSSQRNENCNGEKKDKEII